MSARIEFFPVDNGDMTLVTLESGRTILIDCNIRTAADDSDDDTPDVGALLRDRLERDDDGRPFVDVFLLSHPDQDHCGGLDRHFHLGKAADWSDDGDDKIIIREMWSSPIIFRRRKRIDSLCADAVAWGDEARRRIKLFKNGKGDDDGDRIVVLGHDVDHKSDGLEDILVSINETIVSIGGVVDGTFGATLLAPLEPHEDEEEEEVLAKNRSSVIMQMRITADGDEDACWFLTGGDAKVAIWERLWQAHKDSPDQLGYDVLQTPHHCSWHSLSYDSWSEKGADAKVAKDARKALAQARENARIIASCKTITDDDSDPPCIRAAQEYENIVEGVTGEFVCVADHVAATGDDVLLIEIGKDGIARASGSGSNTTTKMGIAGGMRKTDKRGGGRYARRSA